MPNYSDVLQGRVVVGGLRHRKVALLHVEWGFDELCLNQSIVRHGVGSEILSLAVLKVVCQNSP